MDSIFTTSHNASSAEPSGAFEAEGDVVLIGELVVIIFYMLFNGQREQQSTREL
jgi:hypothetical protein